MDAANPVRHGDLLVSGQREKFLQITILSWRAL